MRISEAKLACRHESALDQSAREPTAVATQHLECRGAQCRHQRQSHPTRPGGPSALARLDRDVLVQPGAKYLIVLQGSVDTHLPDLVGIPTQNVTAAQTIQGHQQIITRAGRWTRAVRRHAQPRRRISVPGFPGHRPWSRNGRRSINGSGRPLRTTP